jgi:hypothetical protein
VIIEDAGHDVEQQVKIYYALKPFLNKGSVYIIEDVQNIDKDKISFENIDREKEVTIIDRRNLRERYDDVIVIIKDKK